MKATSITAVRWNVRHATRVAVLGLLGTGFAWAQHPVLSTAASYASLRPVGAERVAEPGPPEPPQAAQNTAPIKEDLFAGTEKFAKGASDVTEVNMDPNSLNLVGGPDASRAHHMVLSVVRTYSYDKPGMYNQADVDVYRRKLEGGDWHCSVHTRDMKSGETTDVCSRQRAPDMVENAIITTSPKSLTFIHNIRKVNGQGSGLNVDEFPGTSLLMPGVPMALSMQIAQPVIAAEVAASTAALRAQLPEMMQHTEALQLDLQPQMEALNTQTKNLHLEVRTPSPDDLKQLQEQLRMLEQNPPVPQVDLQKLQHDLRELQNNAPTQP